MVTDKLEDQYCYNTDYLNAYHKASKAKEKDLPGYNYFGIIENFLSDHFERGELFFEYRQGSCESVKGIKCIVKIKE